jgi:hypothetical protein
LRLLIRRFDDWLSRVEGVHPFSDDPRVILRIQHGRAAWDIPLPEGVVSAGSPVLFVHLWNERIPPMSGAGADFAWARTAQRSMIHSFRAMARYVQHLPDLAASSAVGGVIAQLDPARPRGGAALFECLGFVIFPYHRPAGRVGEFWENFYTWWLMWTYNPASARRRSILSLRRNEFWMDAAKFLGLFK